MNVEPSDGALGEALRPPTRGPGRPRLAYLVDKSQPFYTGGYEARVWNLAKRLVRDFEVHVLTSVGAEPTTLDGVQFERACSTAFIHGSTGERSLVHSALFALSRFSRLMERVDPDILVVEAIPYLHLPFLRRATRNLRAVRILNVNEAWAGYPYARGPLSAPATAAIRRLLAVGVSWADLVVAISGVTAESLRSNYDARRVEVVPMGADLTAIEKVASGARREAEYDFVSVGRLVGIKRHRDFVSALSLLRRKGWIGQAVLIGDGPLRAGLVRQASRLGLQDCLAFAGFLPEDEKVRVLSRSRVFVLPSEREGFSVACLEAMACGLPVVAARPAYPEVFGASEVVEDGVTGLHAPVGDTRALAQAMGRLLSDEPLRRALSARALQRAGSYDWDAVAAQFSRVVGSVRRRDREP